MPTDQRLDQLLAASVPASDTDLLYIVQSGNDRKIQYQDLNPDQSILAGIYGDELDVPQFTVDQKGRITSIQNVAIADFVGSGASHAHGLVPDPGAVAGTTHFLREDGIWAVPPGGGGGGMVIGDPVTGGIAGDILTVGAGPVLAQELATGTGAPVRSVSPQVSTPDMISYVDFEAIAAPAAPAGDVLRLFVQNTQGFSRIHHLISDGTDLVIGRDLSIIVRNVTGSTLTDGQAVYVSGTTGTIPQVSLAKSDSLTTLPAIGLVMGTIANNGFGYVHVDGIHTGIDTSSFLAGDILYVSATVAGALTATKPSVPFQEMCIVLDAGVNGRVFMQIETPRDGHPLLDGNIDSDTLAGTVVRGDLIVGNSTPKWARKARGAAGQLLSVDGNGDLVWVSPGSTTGAESFHPFLLMGA